jgi:rhodanese-related sulfurtransferase
MNIKLLLPLLAALLMPSMFLAADEKPATATTVVKRIGVDEYDKLRSNTNVVLLDVRSVAEFEKGRIPGAINMDVNSPRFPEMIGTLDKKKAYLVNCAVGMRSAKACKKLEGAGFKELYDLAPGFDGWRKAGKPVQK